MTEFIAGLKIDNLLSMMVPFIYMCVVFGASAFDHLLFAGFGLTVSEKLGSTVHEGVLQYGEKQARLSAFLLGSVLALVSYACWQGALKLLEVWLGQP